MAKVLTLEDRAAIDKVLATMTAGWLAMDGGRLASVFASDADFINILGMHARGRDQINAWHQDLFETIYANSVAVFSLKDARLISDDVAHIIVDCHLTVPSGPRAGEIKTIADAVLARGAHGWEVATFHNTRVAPPPTF